MNHNNPTTDSFKTLRELYQHINPRRDFPIEESSDVLLCGELTDIYESALEWRGIQIPTAWVRYLDLKTLLVDFCEHKRGARLTTDAVNRNIYIAHRADGEDWRLSTVVDCDDLGGAVMDVRSYRGDAVVLWVCSEDRVEADAVNNTRRILQFFDRKHREPTMISACL